MNKSFTLAEVLITLGIIGIIAAMTLPIIAGNARKQEVSARLKKFYTVMNQAVMLSENENGDFKDWDFSMVKYTKDDGSYDYNLGGELSCNFFKKYLSKYLKYDGLTKGYSSEDENGNITNKFTKIYFYDNSSVEIKKGTCMDFIFDINGDRKPNKMAYDKFYFLICPPESTSHKLYPNEKISAYSYITGARTREGALQACKAEPYFCGRLLQIDNWEVKKDYPYKL